MSGVSGASAAPRVVRGHVTECARVDLEPDTQTRVQETARRWSRVTEARAMDGASGSPGLSARSRVVWVAGHVRGSVEL